MEVSNQLIIVNGTDKTMSVASYQFVSGKCIIVYDSSLKAYSYSSDKVRILKLKKSIDPQTVILKVRSNEVENIDKILDFGEFYHIVCTGKKGVTYKIAHVDISENCLADKNCRELFDYFKSTAEAISLKTDDGTSILKLKYDRIKAVSKETVLSKYLNGEQPIITEGRLGALIYPFGLNQSQKRAVENAFSSQISIIQGPPGTGKTQTILNIIANAVRYGKSVAVVSNNNSAISNVADKLGKKGLSFLTAFLGSVQKKISFLERQDGVYPDMSAWVLSEKSMKSLSASIQQLSAELDDMLKSKNRIAEIEKELLELSPEQFYFQEYSARRKLIFDTQAFSAFSSQEAVSLWFEYENCVERKRRLSLLKRLLVVIRFGRAVLALFKSTPEDAIPFLQKLYYEKKTLELQAEKNGLENKLKDYRYEEKMKELTCQSMRLFQAELSRRYDWKSHRQVFMNDAFRNRPDAFNQEYPVILSTTYSIKGTLADNYIYDYLIVDEASQVDLATGVLAFSCAKNIIIVGDQKQLPNVITREDARIADSIWKRHNFDERYHFATHSMLSSAVEIWGSAPSVLLREHYRCHPKIAGFFNQKFYNGDLTIMTEDHGEKSVLSMYRTSAGNHARERVNQRQIDIIKEEILPELARCGYDDIGIITPYRDQASAIKKQLGEQYEIDTVHKFQGREKDAIILTSVDNNIGRFVDDPNLLNVAVSRAVKSLSVVISNKKENEKTNYGDLAKYIEYNNCQIVDSTVFSVFDLLYREYAAQRMEFLKKKKRISEYDSENLAFAVIQSVLSRPEFSCVDCAVHSSLATLVKDYTLLSEAETKYASNPLTHIDFLLFNKMDKKPILAIEIDGTGFHAAGSRQAERDSMKNSILKKCGIAYLRIRTNESGEKERIIAALVNAM